MTLTEPDGTLVEVQNLQMYFPITQGLIFQRNVGRVRAVDDVSFTIRRGETLVVLEAMKMQNEIPAPADGVVRQVAVTEGETVTADRVVASIELRRPSAS